MNIYILVILIILGLILVDKYSTERFSKNIKNNIKNNFEKEHFNSYEFNVEVIHMEKNKDRLINFNNYYYNSDMKFKKYEIFPAVVGKDINLIDYVSPKGYSQILMTEKTRQRIHHYDLTRGAVGCYLSHLAIYKKLINSNLNYTIVFEDDSIMASDFYQRLINGLLVIPNDWDILLLGVMCLKCDVEENYIKINRFWGTHGYLVSKKGATKLVEYLDKPISKQIDADISLLIKRGVITVYGINPIIVAQDPAFGSDIQEVVIDSDEAFEEEFKQNQINNIQAKAIIDRTYEKNNKLLYKV
jgi:glycosyl transferase family 25